ncbi:MAG: ribonuclease Z [Flavobacteriales bacterium]|nr:ribonuclease Z [Flavobacteriales bacterium]NQX97966.1 ribonuclease Z [Flavobacteriales bacterium]
MSKFSVLILGNASASPTLTRSNTSQLINIDEQYYLMDCGEGTQLKLREHKIKLQRISHIFISHLHGDHYLGLIGLLQTMHLMGRESELTIYCPGNIKEVIDVHLKASESQLRYLLLYKTVNNTTSELVFENDKIEVVSIPLKHRIPCSGYLFKEKAKQRRINPKAIKAYNVPKYEINKLKIGDDYVLETGEIIENSRLTMDALPSFSYAFCSDTKYYEPISDIIKGVDLLYHEATFIEEHIDRAKKTYHSTAKQAAQIAFKSEAKRLIIGHFSNRYPDLNVLLSESKTVFKNTELAIQGEVFKVDVSL